MSFKIRCECGRILVVPERREGTTVKCPDCGGKLLVQKQAEVHVASRRKSSSSPASAVEGNRSKRRRRASSTKPLPDSPPAARKTSKPQKSVQRSQRQTPTKPPPQSSNQAPETETPETKAPEPRAASDTTIKSAPTHNAKLGLATASETHTAESKDNRDLTPTPPGRTGTAVSQAGKRPPARSPDASNSKRRRRVDDGSTDRPSTPNKPALAAVESPATSSPSATSPTVPSREETPKKQKKKKKKRKRERANEASSSKPAPPRTQTQPPPLPTRQPTPSVSPTATSTSPPANTAAPPRHEPPAAPTQQPPADSPDHPGAHAASERPRRRGIEWDPGRRDVAAYVACGLAAIALFSVIPAGFDLTQHLQNVHSAGLSRWAILLFAGATLQLAFAAYVFQLRDWSTVWATTALSFCFATTYMVFFTLLWMAQQQSAVLAFLDLGGQIDHRKATGWCFIMLCLTGLFCYLSARSGARWYRIHRRLLNPSE